MSYIEEHYNKFYEEKRLDSRHGQVEYRLTMKYIKRELEKLEATGREKSDIVIADIGAGTGRYAIPLFLEGYDVTAVELVQHNLGIMKQKCPTLNCYKGNALKLKRMEEASCDVVLLLGPMYHLFSYEDKLKALSEAKRICKKDGIIFVAYLMNEYGILTYGFKERHIKEVKEEGRLTGDYQCISKEEHLYDYVRIETINRLREDLEINRVCLFTPDGPANYMRPFLNQLSEEEFEEFVSYVESICERSDLIGAAAHTVDVLKKN
jgi:ubiquinone/menaquinone biosynthesis C-methylase UbiE